MSHAPLPWSDPVLWIRAVVVGTASWSFGTVSHSLADGLLPSWQVMATLQVLTIAGAGWLLTRRASAPLMVSLVVAAQTANHALLTLTAGHRPAAGELPAAPPPGSGWMGALEAAAEHQAAHLLEAGTGMLLAHFAAAVAVGCVLAWAESAAWDTAALLRRCERLPSYAATLLRTWVAPLLVPATVRGDRLVATVPALPARLPSRVAVRPLARRGPPTVAR